MSNVKTFSSKDEIYDQACAWVSKIDRGLSLEERQQISEWVNQSKTHRNALFEMANLWDDLSVVNELSELFLLKTESCQKERYVWTKQIRHSIAACFVGSIFVLSSWFLISFDNYTQADLVQQTQYIDTSLGEHKQITLPDGSLAHLNTNSVLSVNFSQSVRQIDLLQGEVHFDVVHDPNRPFVVFVNDKVITAVGTAFNIEIKPGENIEVLVTEGTVLVENNQLPRSKDNRTGTDIVLSDFYMSAGNRVLLSSDAIIKEEKLSLDKMKNALAWQKGMLVFQGETLISALQEVGRYSEAEFQIIDESIKTLQIAGYFKMGDTEGLLAALRNNFSIRYQKISEDKYVLYSGY